jgi:hypothetical protein
MRNELEKLLEGYKKLVQRFEEDDAEALKDYNDGTMYMCDYVGSNVDDAFEMGEKYGSYTEALEIIDSLERILDIKDTK